MLNNCPFMAGGSMARLVLFVGSFVLLAGCVGSQPQPYSPNYSYLSMRAAPATMGLSRPGVVRKGYDQDKPAATVLVPDACITPDTADQPVYLPSGCSNNLNLQLMVVRKQDLTQGHQMGPAMAAPVARAAQDYMDGVMPAGRKQQRLVEQSNRSVQ
ncbi:hypothetical protein DEV92_107180 [Phyllobacterium myrsinacearum]|uniref:Uncharacterized protein n=2 Tax=Phyllobacterium myrsinacearum TaxID=28101 RepID=A0A2S9JP77_9HYPH|nr:hypothetical protein C5750_07305 [Phyllobacterium myrsinacearum]PWV90456.1 hypothetical protein DEV92_107180 [Phyllobacterium myrsinacearum]RZV05350.1 hypothetical protein EV654_2796 [Phyllobacterium myrsinacearum]